MKLSVQERSPTEQSRRFFVKVNGSNFKKSEKVLKMSISPLTNNEKCVKLKVSQK